MKPINDNFDHPSDPNEFDARIHAAHAAALASVSPQALQRLRIARNEALQARARHSRWWLSATLPALLAVAIGLPYLHERGFANRHATAPSTARIAHVAANANKTASSSDDYSTQLDENPDLYLWMASDGKQLAME